MQVTADISKLNDRFNSASVKISERLLTEHGRARLYLKKVPAQVRAIGLLDTRLDEGADLAWLQFEALRISTQPGINSPVVHHPVSGAVTPSWSPPEPDVVPDPTPMELGVLQQQQNHHTQHQSQNQAGRGGGRRGGRGGGGRGRGRGRSGPPVCHRCWETGHIAKECLAPAPVSPQ